MWPLDPPIVNRPWIRKGGSPASSGRVFQGFALLLQAIFPDCIHFFHFLALGVPAGIGPDPPCRRQGEWCQASAEGGGKTGFMRCASLRATPEAKEGLAAFLDKRPAAWVPA